MKKRLVDDFYLWAWYSNTTLIRQLKQLVVKEIVFRPCQKCSQKGLANVHQNWVTHVHFEDSLAFFLNNNCTMHITSILILKCLISYHFLTSVSKSIPNLKWIFIMLFGEICFVIIMDEKLFRIIKINLTLIR